MTNSNPGFIKKIIRPLIAVLLLVILIKKGPFDFQQLKLILTNPSLLLVGLVLFFLHFLFQSYRWRLFVNEHSPLSLIESFRLTLIGQFFSFFIPGGVGGDFVKAFELSKETEITKTNSFSTVFADRIFGLFSMILFASISLLISALIQDEQTNYLVYSLLMFFTLIFGLVFGPKISSFLENWLSAKKTKWSQSFVNILKTFDQTFITFRSPRLVLKLVLLSLLVQVASTSFLYLVVEQIVSHPPNYLLFFSICCFGFLVSAIPITPAGVGVGQTAFYFLFAAVNANLGTAAVTAISLFQIFYLFFALIGGLLFALKSKTKRVYNEQKKSY